MDILTRDCKARQMSRLERREYLFRVLEEHGVDTSQCPPEPVGDEFDNRLSWLNDRFFYEMTKTKSDGHYYFITITSQTPDPTLPLQCYEFLKSKARILGATIELFKNGNPHIHVLCHSQSYLNKDHLYRKNGKSFVDFKKLKASKCGKHVRSIESQIKDIDKYIFKDLTKPDADWLIKWGLSDHILQESEVSSLSPPPAGGLVQGVSILA